MTWDMGIKTQGHYDLDTTQHQLTFHLQKMAWKLKHDIAWEGTPGMLCDLSFETESKNNHTFVRGVK